MNKENNEKSDISNALKDIELIRRVLEHSEGRTSAESGGTIYSGSQILVQSLAAFFALGLLLMEYLADGINTQVMLLSKANFEVLSMGIASMGIILVFLICALYVFIFSSAQKKGEDFVSYASKHFVYLKNLFFVEDLLLKYVILALILGAGKPEWVAPLLTLFVADYLVQGRFFTIPVNRSLFLAILCAFIAYLQFIQQSPDLIWSLTVFVAVNLYSIFCLSRCHSIDSSNFGQSK